jgi:pimeloyl-ACP methyl ester carboxylesterase
MNKIITLCFTAIAIFAQTPQNQPLPKAPTDLKPGSITYDDVPYPYPVHYMPLTMYGQDVRMAYMDVPPAGTANGRTVILLHGMNFGGFYFGGVIDVLRKEGFRVVLPDQIGFGRSSKPIIAYNFHDMAANTRKLMLTLGVSNAVIVGHSMGGMLAARFSASYPDMVERTVVYNPIGLSDVRYERPWRTAQEAYEATMAQTPDQVYQGMYATIRRYFPTPGSWKPEYENYVRILYAPSLSSEWPRLAMVRAIYQQITYLDPVVYDWPKIKARTLVLGGDKDTADFAERAAYIAKTIPRGELDLLPNLGHVPHIEAPDLFYSHLLKFLKSDAAAAAQPVTVSENKGTVEKIKIHGKALEGNLEGDSPDRDVFVYLPPSYAKDTTRRYPVVYFLHGYGVNAEAYWKMMTVPDTADKDIAANTSKEMILVNPDAFTIYDGSMYSNSLTTGDWEGYVSHDLVQYIDSHYRTIANRDSRGLAGHSMGGYGTLRIGMKHPEVFSALYAMSSCCLMNSPQVRPAPPANAAPAPANGAAPARGRGRGFANVGSAQAAAWAPNPNNPPKFFDLLEEDGKLRPEIAAKYVANSPMVMIDQYVPQLEQYRAIALEVGTADTLFQSNKQLDAELSRLKVPHTYETYEGDHTNRVKERYETRVLPFFSTNLVFSSAR